MKGGDALPSFGSPPLVEVALSLQMKALALLSPGIGLFWNRVRDEFPILQQHPPLAPAHERFPDPDIEPGFKFSSKVETPRIWMMAPRLDRLVQIQTDRIVYNWKKTTDGDQYPRYVVVQKDFWRVVERLREFLDEENLGAIEPTQCEVSYVNRVPVGDSIENVGQVERILSFWSAKAGFAGPQETARGNMTYVMRENDGPCGRLHVSFAPASLKGTATRLLALTLVARGAPLGDGLDGVARFFDKGHEWIVRTFADITTQHMHDVWRRER